LSDIETVIAEQTVDANPEVFTFRLYDDGTNGDSVAGDGKFEYRIGNNENIYYKTNSGHKFTITATDSSGATDVTYAY